MVEIAEQRQGQFQYDVKRALTLDRQIKDILVNKAAAKEIHLFIKPFAEGEIISERERTFLVAPIEPIFDAESLDMFGRSLLPGKEPDFTIISSGGYTAVHGGLSFRVMRYDNVPGLSIHNDRVIKDPNSVVSGDLQALEQLSKETGKAKTELVKATWVRVFPHAMLADFILHYSRGLRDGRYRASPSLRGIESSLSKKMLMELKELKTNPKKLIKGLYKQIIVETNPHSHHHAIK